MANGTFRMRASVRAKQRLAGSGGAQQQDIRLLDFDVGAFPAQRQSLVMVVDGDGQDLLALRLADHVLVQLGHDVAGRRDLLEELLGRPATTLFLLEDRLAQVNALAADVDVAGTFDQRPHVPIALPAERTKRVLLRRTTAPSASARISSSGHNHSFRIDGLPPSHHEVDRKTM